MTLHEEPVPKPEDDPIPASRTVDSVLDLDLKSAGRLPVQPPVERKGSNGTAWLAAAVACACAAVVASQLRVQTILPVITLDPGLDGLNRRVYRLPPVIPDDVPDHLAARCGDEQRRFPLIVSPVHSMSVDAAATWVSANHATVEKWLSDYGAILFRGFDGHRASQFEAFATAFSSRLDNICALAAENPAPYLPITSSTRLRLASTLPPSRSPFFRSTPSRAGCRSGHLAPRRRERLRLCVHRIGV